MRRKQSMQHFDQRQILILENAYYQVFPYSRVSGVAVQHTTLLIVQPTRESTSRRENSFDYGNVHSSSNLRCASEEDYRQGTQAPPEVGLERPLGKPQIPT